MRSLGMSNPSPHSPVWLTRFMRYVPAQQAFTEIISKAEQGPVVYQAGEDPMYDAAMVFLEVNTKCQYTIRQLVTAYMSNSGWEPNETST